MPGGLLPRVGEGDPVNDLDRWNALVDAVNGLLAMQVDGATMTLLWASGIPFLSAAGGGGGQAAIFYTTGSIAAATIAGTGLAARLTEGTGPGRRCVKNSSGDYVPDTSSGASDDTLYNVLPAPAIAANQFVIAVLDDNDRWTVATTAC
jgi:hypothetical protein